jgi:hypothetical protein
VPLNTEQDLQEFLDSKNITRRDIAAKVAEFYDPCGYFEPWKVHMKINMIPLKGIDWDDAVDTYTKEKWMGIFNMFLQVHNHLQISLPSGSNRQKGSPNRTCRRGGTLFRRSHLCRHPAGRRRVHLPTAHGEIQDYVGNSSQK